MRNTIILLLVISCGCQKQITTIAASECERADNSTIIYAAMPGLWGDGFRAVTGKLEYLKELGVNTIWLWPPISQRAPGEEYGITDYFAIDPSWGSEKDFKAFVKQAHRFDLRIIIDFVPNHTSDQHPYYLDALRRGKASRYYDFYDRTPEGNVTHYFGWDHLPNLNYDSAAVRQWMTEAMTYWIKEYDIDGFRMDMAWAILQRSPSFWPQCCRELERLKPGIFLLAEAPASDPNYFAAGFDAAYDWSGPGKWAWKGVFETPENIQEEIETALTYGGKGFAPNGLVLRFINNNDTGERFIERYGRGLTCSASAMQFTLPGIPVVFAGDEIGARYLPSGEVEQIPWKDDAGMLHWYTELIELRNELPVLRSPEMILLESEPRRVLSYLRHGCNQAPAVVIVNFGRPCIAQIQLSLEMKALFGHVYDAASEDNQRFSFNDPDPMTVPLEANTLRVLVPYQQKQDCLPPTQYK